MFMSFFNKANDAASRKGIGYGTAISLAAIALVALSFMGVSIADSAADAAYRVAALCIVTIALLVLAHAFRIRLLLSLRSATLLTIAVLLQMLAQIGVTSFCGVIPGYSLPAQALLWMPYMLAPAIMGIMIGRRIGMLAALLGTACGICLLPPIIPLQLLPVYAATSLVTGIVVAQYAGRVHTRGQILQTGMLAALIIVVTVYLLVILQNLPLGGDHVLAGLRRGFHLGGLAGEVGVTLVLNFVLASVIGGAMPAIENLFNISTPITWLEWADMNHPLLKRLSVAAPGTFHHSMVVQRLAEAAAEAIGADVTRAGVCALYHDIGKIKNDQYFAENILDYNHSPHAELSPEQSAGIIIGHVQEGVQLATEAGLNRRIIAVIREHHGVSTAYFFYRKALDLYEQEKSKFEEGLIDTCPEPVDKALYSYKGPVPQTRESGIVSMADAVESATRSLAHPTEEDIRSMIESIFKGRILDGHLQDSGLTLGDIAKMKITFFNTIKVMHHNRIAYPKPHDDATDTLAAQRQSDQARA